MRSRRPVKCPECGFVTTPVSGFCPQCLGRLPLGRKRLGAVPIAAGAGLLAFIVAGIALAAGVGPAQVAIQTGDPASTVGSSPAPPGGPASANTAAPGGPAPPTAIASATPGPAATEPVAASAPPRPATPGDTPTPTAAPSTPPPNAVLGVSQPPTSALPGMPATTTDGEVYTPGP